MRHANSNLNILKKKRNSKIVKLNNFLKPPSSYKNINSPLTTKNAANKNILYNLLYKDISKISLYNTKNTTNTLKNTNDVSNSGAGIYSFNSKNLCNNSLSIGNSLNVKEERKIRGHINIRLKLNNKINNNNNKAGKVRQKTMNLNIIEKIKEKDYRINKLQMDLLQSQELLNKLQKEKQKELSFTYNSIKSLDNINLSNDNKLSEIFAQITEKNDRILKTNYNKYEVNKYRNKTIVNDINKKNIIKINKNEKNKFKSLMKINSLLNLNSNSNKNKRNNKNKIIKSTNSLTGLSKKKNSSNKYQNNIPKSNTKYFSSYSTNRFYHNKPQDQYELYVSQTRNYFSSRKKDKKISINKKENKKLFNLSKKIEIMQLKRKISPDFKNFVEKCDILKKRANQILKNYINMADFINQSKDKK